MTEKKLLPTLKSTEDWRKSNILIVDDEPDILAQIEADVFREGFSFFKATSAEQGMDILKRQPIHVVLCDQRMPGGMEGTQFLAKVRTKYPHLISIILSAFSERDYLLDAMNKAKVFAYLIKPWDRRELATCLRLALKLSYANRMKNEERSYFLANLLESLQNSEQAKENQERLLQQAVEELRYTRGHLEEAAQAFSTFADVSGQLSGKTRRQLKDGLSFLKGNPAVTVEERNV